MSRRLFPTLLLLVVWLAGVNHCSLSFLLAARSDAGVTVCSHCGPLGAPQPTVPGAKACCQDLLAQLAPSEAKLPAPKWVPLFGHELFRERLAAMAMEPASLVPAHEESPPGYFLGEVLQSSLAANAPPVVG